MSNMTAKEAHAILHPDTTVGVTSIHISLIVTEVFVTLGKAMTGRG